jgi:FkbM family methyltransferase
MTLRQTIDRLRYKLARTIAQRRQFAPGVYPLHGPRVTNRNLKMAVHERGDLYISECIRRFGIWEPTETDYVLDHLSEGDTYIDIGANIGYYSVLASNIVGAHGRVYCFEPEPLNFSLLKTNLAMNDASNATARQAAVSDNSDGATLHLSADNLGDHRIGRPGGSADAIGVDTVRLDPGALRPPAGKVMVKIDTQGWESRIILGNLDALSLATHIIFEWSPRWIAQNGDDPLGVIQALERVGYELRIIQEDQHSLEPFGEDKARDMLPTLLRASGEAADPMFLDIAAAKLH